MGTHRVEGDARRACRVVVGSSEGEDEPGDGGTWDNDAIGELDTMRQDLLASMGLHANYEANPTDRSRARAVLDMLRDGPLLQEEEEEGEEGEQHEGEGYEGMPVEPPAPSEIAVIPTLAPTRALTKREKRKRARHRRLAENVPTGVVESFDNQATSPKAAKDAARAARTMAHGGAEARRATPAERFDAAVRDCRVQHSRKGSQGDGGATWDDVLAAWCAAEGVEGLGAATRGVLGLTVLRGQEGYAEASESARRAVLLSQLIVALVRGGC